MGAVRLHVLSDLHLEQQPFEPVAVDADVIVLAGDVWNGTRGIEWARSWADGRPILYVAGNHEFYGHALPELIDQLRAAAAGSPIHVLENDEMMIDGVRFLGCTLWSDFDFDGIDRREESMRVCARVVNDYEHIAFKPSGRTLTRRDTRMLHLSSGDWLKQRLAEPHPGSTVAVTDHPPV